MPPVAAQSEDIIKNEFSQNLESKGSVVHGKNFICIWHTSVMNNCIFYAYYNKGSYEPQMWLCDNFVQNHLIFKNISVFYSFSLFFAIFI